MIGVFATESNCNYFYDTRENRMHFSISIIHIDEDEEVEVEVKNIFMINEHGERCKIVYCVEINMVKKKTILKEKMHSFV